MRGNVTVRVESVTVCGDQRDVLRFAGRGVLEAGEDGWRLRYTAADAGGNVVASGMRLENGGRAVIVNESGGYELLLDPGKETALYIAAEGGRLRLGVRTETAAWELSGPEGNILLGYTLFSDGAPVSALRLSIELKEER